uniref:Uncharacterized protein n=1 Tax=Acrobeloides nanus TaxID=290746 RepID=A0A914CNH0_9BILA
MNFFKMPIGNFMQVNIGDCNFQVPAHRYTIESIIGGGSYGIV